MSVLIWKTSVNSRLTGRLFHLRSLCGIVEEEALTGEVVARR